MLIPGLTLLYRVVFFTPKPTLAPFDANAFSILAIFARDTRPVFPLLLADIISLFVTLSPLLFLAATYLVSLRIFQGHPWKAFVLSLPCMIFSFPGEDPQQALAVFAALIVISPFAVDFSHFERWLYSLGLIVVAITVPSLSFLCFWGQSSLLLAAVSQFLFAERGHITFRMKQRPFSSSLKTIALFGIDVTSLLILSLQIEVQTPLSPSSFWWAAPIILILALVLTWIYPWSLRRWLALAIVPWGLLWSGQWELPIAFLVFAHLVERFDAVPIFKAQWMGRLSVGVATLVALAFCWKTAPQHRQLNPLWVSALPHLVKDPQQGVLVLGEGFPLLSHFVKGPLVFDSQSLTVMTEEDMMAWLSKERIRQIIVEKHFFNEFWKDWMKQGFNPDISNYSVISRMLTYEGKGLTTATLKFPEIKGLTLDKLSPHLEKSYAVIDVSELEPANPTAP